MRSYMYSSASGWTVLTGIRSTQRQRLSASRARAVQSVGTRVGGAVGRRIERTVGRRIERKVGRRAGHAHGLAMGLAVSPTMQQSGACEVRACEYSAQGNT